MPKCFYQILYWEFSKGKPFLTCTAHTNIEIKTTKGEEIKIDHLSPYSTRKMLGHSVGPSISRKKRIQHLQAVIAKHQHYLVQQKLTREETWTYYHSVYTPSVNFSLPNSSFPAKVLYAVERKIRPVRMCLVPYFALFIS
mgnify:FL=1